MKFVLYNPHHNGDIHLSRGLVHWLMEISQQVDIEEIEYQTNCSPRLLKDLDGIGGCKLTVKPYQLPRKEMTPGLWKDKDVYHLNTWVCQPGNIGRMEISLLNLYYTLCPILINFFKSIGKEVIYPHPTQWIPPTYNYPHTEELDTLISKLKKDERTAVLFCNNAVESKQCSNQSLNNLLDTLEKEHSDLLFLKTNGKEDLLPRIENTNLPEISMLSQITPIIFGQGSGPYEVTKTTLNLFDKNKIFICNSGRQFDLFWSHPFAHAKGYFTNNNLGLVKEVFFFLKNRVVE